MGRVLAKRALQVHRDGSAPNLKVGCKVSWIGRDALRLEYVVIDPINCVRLTAVTGSERTDGLWQTTCFEAFFSYPDGSYVECNFSPSTEWAMYRFDSYRSGMIPTHDWFAPDIRVERYDPRFALTAIVEFPPDIATRFSRLGISAVIEEKDGTISYWALHHPPGKPDFHHPDCFALTLEAPEPA
jgi:hypothetical protein